MKTISFAALCANAKLPRAAGLGFELRPVRSKQLSAKSRTLVGSGIVLHPDSYGQVGAIMLHIHPNLSVRDCYSLDGTAAFVHNFAGTLNSSFDLGLYLAIADCSGDDYEVEKDKPFATMLLYNKQGMLMLPDEHYELEADVDYVLNDGMSLEEWASDGGGKIFDY